MECYGAPHVESPALNLLAKRSFVFENTYVSQPVCTPSRATMLTGLYPQSAKMMKNNIVLDPSIKTIAEMVDDEYHCAYYGKWHLGNETTRQHGFDEWLPLAELPWKIDHPGTPYHQFLLANGVQTDHVTANGDHVFSGRKRSSLPEHLTMASFLAEESARFLSEDRSEPFMLQVHFFEPHNPYTGPLNGLHDPESIPVGPAFMKQPEETSLFNRVRADFYSDKSGPHPKMGDFGEGTPEQKWRRLRAQYYSNVTLVDRAVGRILNALNESGKADETIVVFTSDHGEMAGDHGLLEKRAFYEASAKVPLLLHVPWKDGQPRVIPGNMSHIDLVPTLLELMGEQVPAHLQGVSRVPVLNETEHLLENDVYVQWNGLGDRELQAPGANLLGAIPRRSIVTSEVAEDGSVKRWKLNLCAGDQNELFDLSSDPDEMINLYNRDHYRDRVRIMAAKLRLWQHETGDSAPLPSVQ